MRPQPFPVRRIVIDHPHIRLMIVIMALDLANQHLLFQAQGNTGAE
jgi:hypothetical protein